MFFLLVMMSKEQVHCMICLNKCLTPGTLHLLCDCKYKVHYRCYSRWYKLNPTCIICHKFAFPPSRKGSRLDPLSMVKWSLARKQRETIVDRAPARKMLKQGLIILCLGLILLSLELLFPFFPSHPRLKEGLIIAILITLSTLWFGKC